MPRHWVLCRPRFVINSCLLTGMLLTGLTITGCGQAQESISLQKQLVTNPPPAADEVAAGLAQVNLHRKVIYDAQLSLIAKDFPSLETEIPKLVKQHGGYLADVSVTRTQGEQRSGRWQARIPVDQYDTFLDSVSKLGVPENRSQTAQDVTEEFVDLEARITNKKRLEERIVELLRNSSSELKHVIEVERELARVRGEIEQMEGRLRYLTNRTELTTVSITAREVRDYVPPQSPGFVDRVSQAWATSLTSLKDFGENLAVALVYAVPWLLLLGVVVVVPSAWCLRRNFYKRPESAESRTTDTVI